MHQNVFKGPDAVARYFNPDENPPLPLIEIPDRLNPYRGDGVRIYAKLLTALPAQNVKSLPALSMLENRPQAASQSIVEASSGSTVLSLGILSRVLWGNEKVTAYVTNKKRKESLKLLRFFGLNISLYGGVPQQEPTDPRGVMERLRQLARKDDTICYLGQYDNADNWKSHERWTGPQILQQLPEVDVFSTTVGTGGCVSGTGVFLKSRKPSVTVVGVFNVHGDPTPGPRNLDGFKSSTFPWRESIDAFMEVTSRASYRMSMHLSREGLIAGPSSGEALQGLLDYVGDLKASGKLLERVSADTGELACVFTCSDLPYQYLDEYFKKLDESEFPPIYNEILLSCDQDKLEYSWILDTSDAIRYLYPNASSNLTRLDQMEMKIPSASLQVCTGKQALHKPSVIRKVANALGCRSFGGKTRSPAGCENCVGEVFPVSRPIVIDLRRPEDFERGHVHGSYNLHLQNLTYDTAGGDIYGDAGMIHSMSKSLELLLEDEGLRFVLNMAQTSNRIAVVVCYHGDASGLVTAALRARGITAFCIQDGFNGFDAWRSDQSV